jgi:hypothetical protein
MRKHKEPEWVRKRAGRLRRGCDLEVLRAIEKGYISPSTVDKFYRGLPHKEQREKIAAVIERKDRERSRCRLVVEILRRHCETQTADLHQLRHDLETALCSASPN